MWSYLLRMNNYLKSLDGLLAQGGSLVQKRFDESWDVRARKRGEQDANVYSKLAKKYGVVNVLKALKENGRINTKELGKILKEN